MNTEHIALSRQNMRYALARMTATFAAVPDDRIEWSPSATAKSPLHILSHCVDANRQVTRVLRGEELAASPDWSFRVAGREEGLRELESSVAEFEAALDAMTPERFVSVADSPAGPIPLSEWMHFIGWHLAEHAGQIDYLQTCWDDQESHYPED